MKTALQIVAALALTLAANVTPAEAGKVKQIDYVSKGKLKQACADSGGTFHEDSKNYTCNTDNAWVSCNKPDKECYGEVTTTASRSSGMAKPPSIGLQGKVTKQNRATSRARLSQSLQRLIR